MRKQPTKLKLEMGGAKVEVLLTPSMNQDAPTIRASTENEQVRFTVEICPSSRRVPGREIDWRN